MFFHSVLLIKLFFILWFKFRQIFILVVLVLSPKLESDNDEEIQRNSFTATAGKFMDDLKV